MSTVNRQSTRRLGPEGSDVWHQILDGAEGVLRDEGYAALTSRNIAKQAGLNQQLIYYYFLTMDDLIVAMFRRAADREVKAIERAIASPQPLREMWKACTLMNDNKTVSEYTAMSNRNETLREEVIAFIRKVRRMQLGALKKALKQKDLPVVELPPQALILIASGLGLTLARDWELGISDGHRQVNALVEEVLAVVEP